MKKPSVLESQLHEWNFREFNEYWGRFGHSTRKINEKWAWHLHQGEWKWKHREIHVQIWTVAEVTLNDHVSA